MSTVASYFLNKMFQNEDLKDKLLSDPTYSDKILSHLSRSAMTEQVAKKMPVGTSFEKAMSVIDKDDPRRAVLAGLQVDMPNIIKSTQFGEDPGAAIMKAVKEKNAAAKMDTYKFIQGRSGFFSKAVAPVDDPADYAEWEKRNPGWTSPITSALIGVGGQLASMPLLSHAAKAGRFATAMPKVAMVARGLGHMLAMAPAIGPVGVGAKLLGAGLMSVAGMAALDVARKASASAGHPMGIGGELLAGIPIFGGLNAVAKMGAKGLGRQLASIERNLFTETGRGFNEFTRTADGRLLPKRPITGEQIRARGAEMGEEIAAAEARAAKMKSFEKFEPEDHEAILRGAKSEDVMKARVKINMEKDAVESAAKEKLLQDNILERAKIIQENDGLEYGDAILKAKELLAPTAAQTAAHNAILKANGVDDSMLSFMSPRQRAINAETMARHGMFAQQRLGRAVAIRDEILPPAVPVNKVKPTSPLKLQTEASVIRSGAPERLGLPETAEGELTKTIQQTAAHKMDALSKLRAARKGERTGYEDFLTDLESTEQIKIIKNTVLNNRVNTFNIGAGRILAKLRADSETATGLVGKEKLNKLNIAATEAATLLDDHIARSGFAGTPREHVLRAAFSRAINKFKDIEDEVLTDIANAELGKMVEPMLPAESVGTHETLIKNSPLYAKMRKEGIKTFKATFGKDTSVEEVMKTSDPDVAQKAVSWLSKYKPYFIGAAGITAALTTIDALLPNSADAAAFGRGGQFVPNAFKELITSAGKPAEEMVAKMVQAGYGPPRISENGHALEHLMRSPGFAPKDAGIFARTKSNLFDKILSPGTRDEIHFNARYENGTRAPFSIGKDVGYRSQAILANTEASLNVVKTIMKDAGIESQLDEITSHMMPLVSKYHNQMYIENPYWAARVNMFDDILSGKFRSMSDTKAKAFSKTMRDLKGDVKNLTDPEDIAYYEMLKAEKQKAMDKLAELKPIKEAFDAEYEMYAKGAAEKYATARVAFAADSTGMQEGNAWLEGLLRPNERRAAEEISALNRVYAMRMKETGHDVITGPYIHHAAHPSVNFAADLAHAESFAPDGPEAMRLVNFFSRQAGSKLMIPDTHYIMGKYLPDANKRIEISDMWKMGREGGWDAVRKQMQAKGGYDGALKLIDDVRTAFDPMDIGGSAKWLNRYSAFEVARLLTLSPSVSFKHALKLMGNWTIFPSGVMTQATGEGANLAARQIAHDLAGTTFRGKDNVVDLSKALTSLHHTYAAVSDMAPYELPVSTLDKFLTKWNQLGSVAVNGVERFDRGVTFSAAMRMAAKRGMTPEQAMFGLMDSVLKVNFLTGPNNPKWLKDPFIRTMMLFQGTPFKILEQRAMLAYQGGKDVGNTLKLLAQLRKDVKMGEEKFKWNMLHDEFTRNKDVFGTTYSSQFLKQLLVIGTVIGTGKMAFDSDLWGHTIHIPGVQLGEKGIQLGVNPLVSSAYRTISGANKTDEDEFWLSRFFNTWLSQTGFPAIAHKMSRLNNDDIPAMYKNSKLSYLFGVPRTKDK